LFFENYQRLRVEATKRYFSGARIGAKRERETERNREIWTGAREKQKTEK